MAKRGPCTAGLTQYLEKWGQTRINEKAPTSIKSTPSHNGNGTVRQMRPKATSKAAIPSLNMDRLLLSRLLVRRNIQAIQWE